MQEEMNSEIQAEEIEESQPQQDPEKKKKRDMYFEMTLFFVLGLLIGITFKTEAVKKITIGFNDYQIPTTIGRYDISKLKSNLMQEAAKSQAATEATESIDTAGQPTAE